MFNETEKGHLKKNCSTFTIVIGRCFLLNDFMEYANKSEKTTSQGFVACRNHHAALNSTRSNVRSPNSDRHHSYLRLSHQYLKTSEPLQCFQKYFDKEESNLTAVPNQSVSLTT